MAKARGNRRRARKRHAGAAAHSPSSAFPDDSAPFAQRVDFVFLCVLVCFFLSGLAALLYQAAWLRQFSITFGTSHVAVVAVLAAYMGGLAAGASLASRLINRARRPVLVYGSLEAAIAISALLVPSLVAAAQFLLVMIIGVSPAVPGEGGPWQTIYYMGVAFLVLAIPTALMGATLPLLARYAVRTDREVGPKIGLLYAVNTVGAVVGAVLSGFILLPHFGLRGTVYFGVALNAIVFAVAIALQAQARGKADSALVSVSDLESRLAIAESSLPRISRAPNNWSDRRRWILPIMTLSGALTFTYEVLWTRLLTHAFGGSIYAFATMLAAFLTGIAIGGVVAGRLAGARRQSLTYFAAAQLMIAVASIATFSLLGLLVPDSRNLGPNALFAGAVMVPACFFIGATFPLAVRILTDNHESASVETARLYTWNTLGAIIGSVSAGFILLPSYGFEGALKLAALSNIALAFLVLFLAEQKKPAFQIWIAVFAVTVAAVYHPSRPDAVLYANAVSSDTEGPGTEIFYAVGRSSTVLVRDAGGVLEMSTDGLPESSIIRRGAPPAKHSQLWMTTLPVIARPDAKSLLMIGLGGGVALESAPSSLDTIDVVELEGEVVRANERLREIRRIDPLSDPRVRVVINDARNALVRTSRRYDIIVSQPSHPWTAGASHLYTQEFLTLAKSRLSENGVFLQWINAQYVDAELLRSLTATVASVFSSVRLYQPFPDVLFFLASDGALEPEASLAATGRPVKNDRTRFRRAGVNGVEDLLAALALDREGVRNFSSGAPLSTDDRNLMLTRTKPDGTGLSLSDLADLLAPFDPLQPHKGGLLDRLGSSVDMAYLADQMIRTGFRRRAFALARMYDETAAGPLIDGLGYEFFGQRTEAAESLIQAITRDQSLDSARFVLLKPYLPQLARGRASSAALAIASGLDDEPTMVIEAWLYGAAGEWIKLSDYDERLASIDVAKPWSPFAAKLRADWRIAFAQARKDPRFAREALDILDDELATNWNVDLFILRAGCGAIIGDDDVFRESAWAAALSLTRRFDRAEKRQYRSSAEELQSTVFRLEGLKSQLKRITSDERRTDEVRRKVDEALGVLKAEIAAS